MPAPGIDWSRGAGAGQKYDLSQTMTEVFHWAARNGDTDACRLILDYTEKNPANVFGQTPLDLAQREGHTAIVRLLKNAID